MNKLFIVMPAYNEEENIEDVVKQWHPIVEKIGNSSKLLIVDDGSKDKTFKIMQQLQNVYSDFIPITKKNSGHGSTCLYAYRYAIKHNADYIFQTDSDGQTIPDEFWDFWRLRNSYDFVIGSRRRREDGFNRIFITKVLKLILLMIFGVNVEDSNTPFRLMKSEKLKPMLKIIPKDFFLSNILVSVLIVMNKEKYIWKSITFRPRQGGVNSINFKRIVGIGFTAIKDFWEFKKKLKSLKKIIN